MPFNCRLKAYIVLTFWAKKSKNQSFRNKSGKTQPIRTKFGIRGHVEGWQRSGNFGLDRPILGIMGTQTSPAEPKFFVCVVNHTTFRQLSNSRFSPNLVIKRILVSRHRMWKDILENLNFMGHFPPKSEIENWSNRHLTQSRLQVTGCTAERCCLLHVVVQGPWSFRDLSTFSTTYSCGATGHQKLPNFPIWSTLQNKTPKTYLPVTSLQPGVTSQNDSDFSMW